MNLWRIEATVTKGECKHCMVKRKLLTFFLDGDALGIVDEEHASHFAWLILNPVLVESVTYEITATKVSKP